MKSLFKFLLIIISLVTALLLDSPTLQAQPIDTLGYIQNIKTETVVLVSNNILNGEISSIQEENNNIFSGSTPLIITEHYSSDIFKKNKSQLNECFIHNLSADKQKVHQIRAP